MSSTTDTAREAARRRKRLPGREGAVVGGPAGDRGVEEGERERDGEAGRHRLAAHVAVPVLTAPLVVGEEGREVEEALQVRLQ